MGRGGVRTRMGKEKEEQEKQEKSELRHVEGNQEEEEG